ncbi:MAG: serine hydrolase domain-containing protein [Solimonas sp.]
MTDPALTAKLDELFKPWNRSDAPGFVVGVARRGELLYRRGFGLASIEHARANTAHTRMRIGSTSKHFCALGILLLADAGKLDLDRPVRDILPDLGGSAGEPTLRQLLHHTGGVRDPLYAMLFINRGHFGHAPAGSGRQLMSRFRERNFVPGERMVYSNAGYTLLSHVIEQVSGLPLAEFFRQRLFAPLGMHDTALWPSDLDIAPNLATFHMPQPGGGWRRGIYPSDELLGSGGIVSTVDDMLAWAAHLRGEHKIVGSADIWARMLERPRYNNGLEGAYSMGLMCDTYRGVQTIHHAGATMGTQCQMLVVPQHGLDIIVMSNRMDGAAPAMADKIVDAVLEDVGLEPARTPAAADAHAALLGRWYAAASHTVMTLGRMKTALADAPEALLLSLHHTPSALMFEVDGQLTRFAGPQEPIEIPLAAAGGDVPSMKVTLAGTVETFTRMSETPPAAATLAPALCGRYRDAEFGIDVEIALHDDKLVLDFLPLYGHARWELAPFSDDVLGCGRFDASPAMPLPMFGTLSMAREAGKVRGFWLNADRVRHAWFAREDAQPK